MQGAALLSLLLQLEDTQWWSPEDLRAAQLLQLNELLAHCHANVPYYGPLLRGVGYAPQRGIDWDTFARIPVLRRTDVLCRGSELRSRIDSPERGRTMTGATRGSTGTPIRFARSGCDLLILSAHGIREHLWRGRDLGAKHRFILSTADRGAGPGWGGYIDHAFITGPYATLDVGEHLAVQAQWLAEEAPAYLLSHGSNLRALARYCIDAGIRIPSLREVSSFGEVLPPDLRALAGAAWNVPVSDHYSAEEAGSIALQCPQHDCYHVQAERLILEVVDADGTPCGPGETGRVRITTLHNFAMPLLRYEIGDFAIAGPPCACGRGLPVLSRIVGRSRNMLTLPDRSQHWPSLPAELWLEVAPFHQLRLLQRSPEQIVARFVIDRPLTDREESRLAEVLREKLGYPFDVRLERVAALECCANGKFEDFVSEIGG